MILGLFLMFGVGSSCCVWLVSRLDVLGLVVPVVCG
jgi:hypothetical protein